MSSLLLRQRTLDDTMHEHNFRRTHRIGNWQPVESGLLRAPEEWVNNCDCGETRKIKTRPRGFWVKSQPTRLERVRKYPGQWANVLKRLLKNREGSSGDLSISSTRILRLSGIGWVDLENLIDALLRDGIIEKFEPYLKSSRATVVVFKEEVIIPLIALLGLDLKEREREKISLSYASWECPPPENPSAKKLINILEVMKKRWSETSKPVVPSVPGKETIMASLPNYLFLLEAIREIFSITSTGEILSFRELAVRVTGDSKGLEGIKTYLRTLLGDLEQYGIREHSPLIFCKLPIIGKIGEKELDLFACEDYSALTLNTARSFIPVSGKLRRLILIENLTPFEKLAKEILLSKDSGIVFLSGYPPGHIKFFVKKIIEFSSAEGLVWCDLDPDGVEIALTVGDWFGPKWRPIFMDGEFLVSSKSKSLADSDREKIKILNTREGINFFKPLLLEMAERGIKVEQEAQTISIIDFLNCTS